LKALLAILAAAAILSSEPAPVEKTFAEGETLDYTVQWMKVTGGTARMTIAAIDDNRYRITSVARSGGSLGRLFRIRDEIETLVDRRDFSTLQIKKKLDERGDKMNETTTIENGVATRKRYKTRKIPVPRPVTDPISVIYQARTLDLTPGKSYTFDLYADLKLYKVNVKVLRREVVQTPAGTFNCVLVEPDMATVGGIRREETLHIWYSDDERRIPVRVRTDVNFGSITATLRSVQSGVSSIEPPALVPAKPANPR
jgi:hypothetical protein